MVIRVVHVIIGLGRGGAEMALTRLITAHSKNPIYQHTVISLTGRGCYGDVIEYNGATLYTLGLTGVLSSFRVFGRLIGLLSELRPDVVQTWMYHADLFGGFAALFAGRPPVLWGIRSFDLKRGASKATRVVQKICALVSRWLPYRIICVAEASRANHIDIGYCENKMIVIPNGFNTENCSVDQMEVKRFRSSIGVANNDLLIGCIGRFHPAKDHHNFICAASLLCNEFNNVRFIMVGPGVDSRNELLNSWIDRYGLGDLFVLSGEREDIPLYLSAMDIFCSPSKTEAFPQVVGEAMLMGVPAVVTDVGDTAFVVGTTAVVVPPENSQALADGLASLARMSKEQRKSMGAVAKSRLIQEFSIDRTVKLTESVYAQAVSSSV